MKALPAWRLWHATPPRYATSRSASTPWPRRRTCWSSAPPAAHVLVISADLAQEDAIERVMATTLSAFHGRLDVLVNNASALGPTPLPYLLDYPLEAFRRVL